MNIGIVLAGGTGNRYGSKIPKQYLMLNGKEVISYAIEALKKSNKIDVVIVACDKTYQDRISKEYDVVCTDGGDTRNITIKNALVYIENHYSNPTNIIFIDSARPLTTTKNIDDCIEKLSEFDTVITGQKITDSLGCYNNPFVNRDDYYLIQTPECFRFEILNKNFNIDSTATALCQQMPTDSSTYVYFGLKNNPKITYPGDITYIEHNYDDLIKANN